MESLRVLRKSQEMRVESDAWHNLREDAEKQSFRDIVAPDRQGFLDGLTALQKPEVAL